MFTGLKTISKEILTKSQIKEIKSKASKTKYKGIKTSFMVTKAM